MGRSQRKLMAEEEFLHRQALSMALQQNHLSQRFDGSMSRRIGSTSSRRRNLSDSFSNGKQAPDFLENIKFKKFVLVHGEGFGAWSWYKTIALLEETGLVPIAIDLTGCGIDLADTNNVTTLAEYSKPLISYLQNLPEDEQVILRPFDVFAEELGSAERFMLESQFLIHGNGEDKPPTGFMFKKQQMKGLYFNQSQTKDVALAMVSMRPVPLGPIMEKLSLSPEKYGTGRRFFIQTLDDRALSPDVQEKLVRDSPPERVFKIKGSDHCPFFSKPQALHKILLEIAQIP
ncbi:METHYLESTERASE FAMILY MEMBER [Salix koriyanagi]|uniref:METHYLESTERASE FAMILY MEMBER n=1 Tax=Salix koriyanagi TaxID=2511006 RepID=A0A9Q1A4F3_9ROSI|nr:METHYLESTERASE FAMILY MEMBER [Salix koriyanagi]